MVSFSPLLTWSLDLIGFFPLTLRRFVGRVIGSLVYLIPTRERIIALYQLNLVLPQSNNKAALRAMYEHFGVITMESLNLKPLLEREPPICDDSEKIKELLSRGRGIVALTAHFGNWELLGAYFAKLGVPINTIGREARNQNFHRYLAKLRERMGVTTLWRGDKNSLKEIYSVLESNGVLAALIDQDTRVKSSFVPFFGMDARTPVTLVSIAKRLNSTIVSAFIAKIDGQYKIFVNEIPQEMSEEEILATFNQRLESLIRSNPEQWVWFHKRWRSEKNGVVLGSRDYIKHLSEKVKTIHS